MNKRGLIRGIVLVVVLGICNLYYYRYFPIKSLNPNHYNIHHVRLHEQSFQVAIDTSQYPFVANHEYQVEELVQQVYDTDIMLSSIKCDDNRVHIQLVAKNTWDYHRGRVLTTWKYEGGNSYSGFNMNCVLKDDKGEEMDYDQFGIDPGSRIGITLKKEKFYSHDVIQVEWWGYHEHTYSRK